MDPSVLRRLRLPRCERQRKMERGAREGRAGARLRLKRGRGVGRGRSHDARGAGAVAASVPCDSGAGRRWGNALMGGAGCQRQNVGKGGAAAVAAALGWCGAGLARLLGRRGAGPTQGARGRLSRAGAAAGAGPRPEMRRRGRGEGAGLAGGAGRESRKGGRGKIILFLFPTIFQIHFQLDFEFIWILNQNHSSQK